MPAPKHVTWKMDPHTEAKHLILETYLKAWLPIMALTFDNIIVLDGFAGPGLYDGGQKGSPLIALDTLLDHTLDPLLEKRVQFIFIERNSERCEHLEAVLSKRELPSNVTCEVYCGNFDNHLTRLLDELDEADKYLAPTFAFVDPFGYSATPMSVIARLMIRFP